MAYTIYLRRNKVNGKCYVGQTGNFKRREKEWKRLKVIYANKYIDEDRTKYGIDNWTVEILAEADNRENAWELEQRFIRDFNTLWPNGYNLEGGGLIGKKHSDVSKQKMSESHKGKHLSDNTRQKISEKLSEANKGKHLSDETKQKMSESHKGKRHFDNTRQKISEKLTNREDISKTVYQYTLDGVLKKVWSSTMECHRNDFNSGAVSQCCNGKLKTYKGHKWSYTPL